MTALTDIEQDEKPRRPVLSMRVKASVVGASFLVLLGLIAYQEMPNAVQALRSLGQGATLVENESRPPGQETPSESLEQEAPEQVGNEPSPELVEEDEPLGQDTSSLEEEPPTVVPFPDQNLELALGEGLCAQESTWIINWTYYDLDYGRIPQSLRPYALVEGDIPPMEVDVGEIVGASFGANATPTSQLLAYMNKTVRVHALVRNFHTASDAPQYPDLSQPKTAPAVDGFEQHWLYVTHAGSNGSSWGGRGAVYEFALFADPERASEWFNKCVNRSTGRTLRELAIGDRSMVIAHGSTKAVYAVKGDIGFFVLVPVLHVSQPDEGLAETLANVVLSKIREPAVPPIISLILLEALWWGWLLHREPGRIPTMCISPRYSPVSSDCAASMSSG